MKTICSFFLFTAILIFSATSLNAQKFSYGVNTGLNISKYRWNKIFNPNKKIYSSKRSYNLNFFLTYKVNEHFNISLEPGLTEKGASTKVFLPDSILGPDEVVIRQRYIHIPLLLEANLSHRLCVLMGPEIAFLLNNPSQTWVNVNLAYDKLELGGIVGLHYKLNEAINLGLRYGHGFTALDSIKTFNANGEFIGNSKRYNQYFQLLMRFKIKRAKEKEKMMG